MTGQIPKYGENFKHDRVDEYSPIWGTAIYALKADERWFIRADKTSKKWCIWFGVDRPRATRISPAFPSLTVAMGKMLEGIKLGVYSVMNEQEVKLLEWAREAEAWYADYCANREAMRNR
jgi:hypothetical protein